MIKSVLVSFALLAVTSEAFDVTRDVRFMLFTRTNPTIGQQLIIGDPNSISNSNFNPQWPTRFLIHGHNDNSASEINLMSTAAYLRNSDNNVIVVDWSAGADSISYITARSRVFVAGPHLARFLEFLADSNQINFSEITIAGHGLGAHLSGVAGKNANRRVGTIFGLNPAGPLFSLNNPADRLDFNDAQYVEVVHTDSTNGIGGAIGHVDFFVNGGSGQPGCFLAACSHNRAVLLFVESINSNRLVGRSCNMVDGCIFASIGDSSNAGMRGSFELTTNSNSPFGQG